MISEENARAYVAGLCGPDAIERLELLVHELKLENEQQNLVAKATLETVWLRHIADSAQLLEVKPEPKSPWLDLGSGPGFPGLVIAAMRPDTSVHLVESRRRRIEWLERISRDMQLKNCTIHGDRLERVETFRAGCITARAFAPLEKLLQLSARFSTSTTVWLLPKGRSAQQEVDGLSRRKRKMFHVKQSRTDRDAGIIVGKGRIEAKQ